MSEINVRPIVAEVFKDVISEHPLFNADGEVVGLQLRFKDGHTLCTESKVAIEQAQKLVDRALPSVV